jgi:hypothetical protein
MLSKVKNQCVAEGLWFSWICKSDADAPFDEK